MDQADIEMPNGGGRATPSAPTPLRSAGAGRGAAQGVQSMGDVGTAFAARRATMVQAQVDAIPSFAELAGVEFAPPASMIKIHITPLLNKPAAELIDVEESVRATRFAQFIKDRFLFDEQGHHDIEGGVFYEENFLRGHPEGVRSFSSCADNRMPSEQVSVLIKAEFAEPLSRLYRVLGFNVVVTAGRYKTRFNSVFVVPATFDNRRKTNIVPAEVVRGIALQLPGKDIGVLFDRDRFPGKRLYAVWLDEEEFGELSTGDNQITLLGDRKFEPVPYVPREGVHTIFMQTGMAAVEAVEQDVVPLLSGWLGVPQSRIAISVVPGNVVARSFKVFEISFPYSTDAYDQAYELTQRKVVRVTNPRREHLGGMAAFFTASLPDMQSLTGGRLLIPPRVAADDEDEEDDAELPSVIPRALLQGPEQAGSWA